MDGSGYRIQEQNIRFGGFCGARWQRTIQQLQELKRRPSEHDLIYFAVYSTDLELTDAVAPPLISSELYCNILREVLSAEFESCTLLSLYVRRLAEWVQKACT